MCQNFKLNIICPSIECFSYHDLNCLFDSLQISTIELAITYVSNIRMKNATSL
jgi:hypothetical protein